MDMTDLLREGRKEGNMLIDPTKPLKAKIFDTDDLETIEIDVQVLVLPHSPYTKQVEIIYNGGKSATFKFLPQE